MQIRNKFNIVLKNHINLTLEKDIELLERRRSVVGTEAEGNGVYTESFNKPFGKLVRSPVLSVLLIVSDSAIVGIICSPNCTSC